MTMRELGGTLGVAIAAGVFSTNGSTATARDFLAGTRPALLVAALTVAAASLAALALPGHGSARARHLRPATSAATPSSA
jgi:hypothetical protein